MRIIQLHNWHRFGGGSEAMVRMTTDLLRQKKHDVHLALRDSRQLGRGVSGRIRAFACGIYSPSGRKAMVQLLREHRPDLVHAHEVYPFFSPWSLVECRRAKVPVIMTVHDCRFTCPITVHWRNGVSCRLCVGGREYWCVAKNCRGNFFESAAYALRSVMARKWRLFQDNVTGFITPTAFVKSLMVEAGLYAESIAIVPNMIPLPEERAEASGNYVAYAGRISPAKGIETLLAAAKQTGLSLQLAGDDSAVPKEMKTTTPGVKFLGHLQGKQLALFYQNARFLVVPSISYECSPVVIAEAMAQALPVIASRTGGIPEMVEDGHTGLLFEPANAEDLASKMKWLWEHRDVCRQMGLAGREKAVREYSEDVHYRRLLEVYDAGMRKRVATG